MPSLHFKTLFANKKKKKKERRIKKNKGGKMTLWLRGGEKERMHGYYVCRRFENL